jgi:GTP-binding protein
VVINKIDRQGARSDEVLNEIYELFIELNATEAQFDFKTVYASGKSGFASLDKNATGGNLVPLFETILKEIPAPRGDENGPLQIIICNIDYDEYVGRVGIGRVVRGNLKQGQSAALCKLDKRVENVRVAKLYQFEGLKRVETQGASFGDIVAFSGIDSINISETICDLEHIEPLPAISIDEPTLSMMFMVNNSPFAGREGKFVTSRHLRDRLLKEVQTNVSLRVEETASPDSFKVFGRGELHLSVLIEQMRRQGYEFQVSRPKVIFRKENNDLLEPIEMATIDVPEEYVGVIMSKTGSRRAELVSMVSDGRGSTRLNFKIPARGLIGYRSEMLTDTKGFGVLNHVFFRYEPFKGEINERERGSLISYEEGEATGYGLFGAQERGRLFAVPGTKVYEGMIVGENAKDEDIIVNVCRKKQLTNTRASGSDDALKLFTPVLFSLEQSLEFIKDDEYVEITPKNIRLRKAILDKTKRNRASAKNIEEV